MNGEEVVREMMSWKGVPTREAAELDILAKSGEYELELLPGTPSDHSMLILTTEVDWHLGRSERSEKTEDRVAPKSGERQDYVSKYAKTKIAKATNRPKEQWVKVNRKGGLRLKNFDQARKEEALYHFNKMKFGMNDRYVAYSQKKLGKLSAYIKGTMSY